jgi:Flp pilus assembly protein TadB
LLLLLRFTFVVRALGFLLINFMRTEREREREKRNSSALLRESTAEAQRVSRRERHELNSKIIIPQHTQSALLRTTTTTTTTTRQRRRRTRTINKHNKYLGIGGFLLLLLLWEEDFLLVLGIAL